MRRGRLGGVEGEGSRIAMIQLTSRAKPECLTGPADAAADRGGLVADRVAAFAADLVELAR
jgi:hypothetical protein